MIKFYVSDIDIGGVITLQDFQNGLAFEVNSFNGNAYMVKIESDNEDRINEFSTRHNLTPITQAEYESTIKSYQLMTKIVSQQDLIDMQLAIAELAEIMV